VTVSQRPSDQLPRPVLGVAIGVAVVLVLGVIVASRLVGAGADSAGGPAGPMQAANTGQLALAQVPAPASGSPECATLIAALPATLPGDQQPWSRRELAKPAPPATAAWSDPTHQPVVLRCGIDRPAELTPTSQLRVVSGVQWLPVVGDGATTWYLVDRQVYVALTIPAAASTGPLQDVSAVVGRTLTAVPIRVN
jgi:hypothetical protein